MELNVYKIEFQTQNFGKAEVEGDPRPVTSRSVLRVEVIAAINQEEAIAALSRKYSTPDSGVEVHSISNGIHGLYFEAPEVPNADAAAQEQIKVLKAEVKKLTLDLAEANSENEYLLDKVRVSDVALSSLKSENDRLVEQLKASNDALNEARQRSTPHPQSEAAPAASTEAQS